MEKWSEKFVYNLPIFIASDYLKIDTSFPCTNHFEMHFIPLWNWKVPEPPTNIDAAQENAVLFINSQHRKPAEIIKN